MYSSGFSKADSGSTGYISLIIQSADCLPRGGLTPLHDKDERFRTGIWSRHMIDIKEERVDLGLILVLKIIQHRCLDS